MKKAEIIHIRKKVLKQTQKEFAELLSVSTRTIMRWENGQSKPKGNSLKKLDILRLGIKNKGILSLVKDAMEYGNVDLVSKFINSILPIQEWIEPKLKKRFITELIKTFRKVFHY
jgi:transcriptional regulator with XRE-family HTH domain